MFSLIMLLSMLSFDRVEAPYAVLYDDAGEELSVNIADLPLDARPGDLLESVNGSILPSREARLANYQTRREALEAEISQESQAFVLHHAPQNPSDVQDSTTTSLTTVIDSLADKTGEEQVARMSGRSDRSQLDRYSRKAKEEGFHARSVYKLEEIDQKVRLIHPGDRILDLGCSPGSWTQYCTKAVGPKGLVVGIDLKAVKPIAAKNVRILQGDIFATPAEVFLGEKGEKFDAVLSDMAPNTCGDRFTDHVRSVELCRRAFSLTDALLRPGGSFVCKIFEGGELQDFVEEVKPHFKQLRRVKPKSTRSESVELFVVAQGFLGPEKASEEVASSETPEFDGTQLVDSPISSK